GEGRPFFGKLDGEDVLLGDPTVCIRGEQVTHLVFPVKR
ncbi:MAG: Dihydrofolate reductase, partial [Acidimicrobiia bacterium]|nr:Dihydrofolate reductase [Acidimicrobiia bacterium]